MNPIAEIIIFVLVSMSLLGILIYKILHDAFDLSETMKNQYEKKIQFEQNHIKFLEEIADPLMIYNYFLETKQKLPINLHNIMLGMALKNNFYATSYIKQYDSF